MREHSQSGRATQIWIPVFLFVTSLTFGCSKSERTTSRDVQPSPSLVATFAPPVATPIASPNRQTAAERFVEIDRLLATSLTGSPEQCDQRIALRAERAALISSGQVPYQSGNQVPEQSGQSSGAPIVQHSSDVDSADHASTTADPQSHQIVIAANSQASSLPFLEQMTPTERDHYFQELWLQNSSRLDVNVNHSGFGLGRFGLHHRWANRWPPGRARMVNQP
jgi:hypothetical protein